MGQNIEITESKRLTEVDQSKKATALLNSAIAKYNTNADLWYYLGVTQLNMNQSKLAAESFDKGIALNDKAPLNYVGRGCISLRENNLQKAEIDFSKALSLSKSKNPSVIKAVSQAYLRDANLGSRAIELLMKAKSIDDHDAEVFILLGDAYLAQNNGGLAVTNYERAASLNVSSAMPYYKIGLVYLRSRNFKSAEENFNKAIQVDAAYTLAYKELGELYYQMKEGTKAVKAYEQYLSLTDNPEHAQLRYAFFLFMAKEFGKANKIFANLESQAELSPTTLRFYAFSLFEAGDYKESRKIFEQYFLKTSEGNVEASDFAYYGKLLIKQKQDSLAVVPLQKSLQLDSSQFEILQLLAETYFQNKKYPEAIEAYEKLSALRDKPVSQNLYMLGRAYYFNQQYDKADATFQKLIDLQPNMTVGYLWEARTKSNLDPESENGLAKPFYEKVVDKALATPEKNKNELIESYSYLAYYYFLKQELATSKSYWNKVLAINPNDLKAKEALKALQ
jgi:tetratricopeptide (TPR) repeat protein